MADRMRKPLLIVLGTVCVAAVSSIGVFSVQQRIVGLKGQIARYETLTTQLEHGSSRSTSGSTADLSPSGAASMLAALRSRIARERARYYSPGSMTTSRFASTIQAELEADGLTMVRYRPIEDKPGAQSKEVEFLVQGPGEAVLSFLKKDLSNGKYRYIRDVSIHAAPGGDSPAGVNAATGASGIVDATLRLGYETIGDNSHH